ncbi:phosphatidylserine decarboxylase [Coprinopsis sp. MPI-PUGE-AT-0042]|nr:phosphatidylserine decarboxylase [Coprinopsis sp. MPI-PUGE-AT-0042]
MASHAGWLPSQLHIIHDYLKVHHKRVLNRMDCNRTHEPAVARFAEAILADAEVRALLDQAFLQADRVTGVPTNLDELLHAMSDIISTPPTFHVAKDDEGNDTGEAVGAPMFVLFHLLCNTSAGYDLFRKPIFNAAFKDVLDSWGHFLASDASSTSLHANEGGWFTQKALESLEGGRGEFNATYVCPDPTAVNRGFTSWDSFFTRQLQPSARPILHPEDKSLLYNACESTVHRTAYKVKKRDHFWLKTQPYSLYDMLNRDEHDAERFVGGTVYQAFLCPLDYHRWHAPVDGVVAKVVQRSNLANAGDPFGVMDRSQAWLTISAARVLIFIEADNPAIGLMCFIAVGMGEVSTCEALVKVGDNVKAGQEIGMFHYGGSSHTLIFGPQAGVTFAPAMKPGTHHRVNSIIGHFAPKPFRTPHVLAAFLVPAPLNTLSHLHFTCRTLQLTDFLYSVDFYEFPANRALLDESSAPNLYPVT